jgi:hypothetical protein
MELELEWINEALVVRLELPSLFFLVAVDLHFECMSSFFDSKSGNLRVLQWDSDRECEDGPRAWQIG